MPVVKRVRFTRLASLLCLAAITGACATSERRTREAPERSLFNDNRNAAPQDTTRQPTIAAAPVEQGEGGYKVAAADRVTFTVRAPDAKAVKLFYQPVIADERFVALKTPGGLADEPNGEFRGQLQLPADFTGDVWALVTYPDGSTKQTERLSLTTRAPGDAGASKANDGGDDATRDSAPRQISAGGADAIGKEESARSDKATGGRVARTSLAEGRDDIRITVNVPAFLLTLWQGGKQVATYPVGVGRKNFPIPIDERTASQIILNPAWIPPDSSWVSEDLVGERIEADDPRNPLGKIKIPLGDAYLIHEAARPSDIGNLVSHGCIRMLTDDIFDLTNKIARAQGLPITTQEIERAQGTTERRSIALDRPLTVDINYDIAVIEGGVLHLYPDVYERDTNGVERLRRELKDVGVDDSRLGDEALRAMLARVSPDQKFVVKVSDVKADRVAAGGRSEPLTFQQAKELEAVRLSSALPGAPRAGHRDSRRRPAAVVLTPFLSHNG